MLSRFSSSSTSRKCLTDRAIRSEAQTSTTSKLAAAGIVHQLVQPGPARLGAGDPVGVFMHDLIAALGGHLPQVEKLGLGVLVQARDPHI